MRLTIEQLREQRAALKDQILAITNAADGRSLTEDELTQISDLRAQFDSAGGELEAAMTARQVSLEAAVGPVEFSAQNGEPRLTLGQHFVAETGERITGLGGRWAQNTVIGASEYTNASSDPQTTTSIPSQLLTQLDTSTVTGLRRRLTIRDLLASGTLTGNAITYFLEGALEGDFTTVAQNAQKPQMHFTDPTAVTEALKKIAGYIKLSTEMLEDAAFLVSEIDTRLLYQLALFTENQLLNGNGTGTNVLGLLNRVGIQTVGSATDPAADNPDLIFDAIGKVSTATGLDADGIVIHPTDYQAIRLSKDANDQYFGGGFFAGQYGNGAIMEQPPLWGLRTVVTPAIAQGTVLVKAFNAATVYNKGGVRVEASNADGNDFTNNRVTVLAEERVALVDRHPATSVKVTLGAA